MTLTIRLEAKLQASLRRLADSEGTSVSDLVRKLITDRVELEATKTTPYERGKHLFGRRGSGKGDLSVNTREQFKEYVRAKHSR